MTKSSSKIKVGSLWKFKHTSPALIVKVFEINKIYIEEKVGKRVKRTTHTEVVFGLRSSHGHICQTLEGFKGDYLLVKNG